jgi:signal transduction histidine kinase
MTEAEASPSGATPPDAPGPAGGPPGEPQSTSPSRAPVRSGDDERGRIADALHDDTLQALVAVAMRTEMLGRRVEQERDRDACAATLDIVRDAMTRLREIIDDLRLSAAPGGSATEG